MAESYNTAINSTMKATDIIRNILDLIDNVDTKPEITVTAVKSETEPAITGVDTNRFKHIFAMLDAERSNPPMYSNSPKPVVADIEAVTCDAGGGWNGPKNPADMKSNSISLYPNYQAKPKG